MIPTGSNRAHTANASKHVYLSGGMEYASDEGRSWRTECEGWLVGELGCTVFNPNRESERFLATAAPGVDFRRLKHEDPERFQVLVHEIVARDCAEIAERTDIVICYWDQGAVTGAGTKGEITIARYFGKPVYLVTAIPPADIPGWVLGCTTKMFPSFDALREFLSRKD